MFFSDVFFCSFHQDSVHVLGFSSLRFCCSSIPRDCLVTSTPFHKTLRSDGTALKDASFWSFIFAASSLALQGRSFLCVGLLFMGPPFSGTVLGCPLCSKDSTVPFNEQKRKRNLCSHHKIFSWSIGRHSTDHAFFSCLLILLAAN